MGSSLACSCGRYTNRYGGQANCRFVIQPLFLTTQPGRKSGGGTEYPASLFRGLLHGDFVIHARRERREPLAEEVRVWYFTPPEKWLTEMAHKCDACGRTFETLTSRRLHNCSAETSQDYTFFDEDFDVTERIKKRNEKRRRERRRLVEKAVGDRLDNVLAAAHSGGPVEAFTAVARFEQELREALRRDDDGETYMAVFWTYLEPVSEAVNETARNEGWPFIADLVDGYDPQVDEGLPHVAGVVANVVARGIIRARLPVTEATRDSRSLDRVPPSALTYLENIPRYDEGSSIVAWEESIHYGWAVGHPDVPVRSTISDLIDVDPVWSGDAAAQALIASQNESVELFCEVLRRAPVEDRAFIASILSRLEGEPPADRFPRFWDPETALDQDDPFTFTFDERVADELRSTIEELGLASRLDSDWDFADLEY